ncbi:MAG: hypothetical protein AAF713_22150 [Pseudomonadota bacterium]
MTTVLHDENFITFAKTLSKEQLALFHLALTNRKIEDAAPVASETDLPDDPEACCKLIFETLSEELDTNERDGTWGADSAVDDALVIAEHIIEGRDYTDALENPACVSALDNIIVRARHVNRLQTLAKERARKIARHGVKELRETDADFKRRAEALEAGREPPRSATLCEIEAVRLFLERSGASEIPTEKGVADVLTTAYREKAET